MSKFALCIPSSQAKIDFFSADVQPIPEGFFGSDFVLADRATCETDRSLMQLIPYIVLRNQDGGIFCYSRGDGGAEDRLHGKLSVGLGGHVDTVAGDEYIVNHLLAEGERELREEVGIAGTLEAFDGMIYTGSNGLPVDQVHLGLLSEYRMQPGDTISAEKGNIDGGRFLSLLQLLVPATFERLEPWSQAAVTAIAKGMSRKVGRAMETFGELISGINIESPTGLTSATTQETGAVLVAVGRNLVDHHATARLYDAPVISDHLFYLLVVLRDLRELVGHE